VYPASRTIAAIRSAVSSSAPAREINRSRARVARAQAAEERSRAQAAAGLSTEEIRKAEELANWEFVKDRNDVQDLRDHLSRFPSGTTERYALTKLDQLVWAALGSTPDITQLRGYVDEFPKGSNAAQAQTRTVALEKEAAEQREADQRRARETADWAEVAASTETSTDRPSKDIRIPAIAVKKNCEIWLANGIQSTNTTR
jgi:hypothetical protein